MINPFPRWKGKRENARPMTPEEVKAFDKAFRHMDESFKCMDKAFTELRKIG